MQDIEKIKRFILEFLTKTKRIGGSHTVLDNLIHCLPDSLQHNKEGKKAIEKAVKDLRNSGWIITQNKRTGRGSEEHVWINPRFNKQIAEFIGHGF